MDAARRIAICHRCPSRSAFVPATPLACTVDGRPVVDHAAAGDCPLGRFPLRGLGDLVARALAWCGVGLAAKRAIERATGKPCGCASRQATLNQLVPARRPRAD
jgi:hypothetical protein